MATVTGTSRVTTWPPLTVAVSPAPGTPAPPHVEALLQFPLVVLLKVAAASGAAVQTNARKHHENRIARRLIMSLPHDQLHGPTRPTQPALDSKNREVVILHQNNPATRTRQAIGQI